MEINGYDIGAVHVLAAIGLIQAIRSGLQQVREDRAKQRADA